MTWLEWDALLIVVVSVAGIWAQFAIMRRCRRECDRIVVEARRDLAPPHQPTAGPRYSLTIKCARCDATAELPRPKYGPVDIEPLYDWTFDTREGWLCPAHS